MLLHTALATIQALEGNRSMLSMLGRVKKLTMPPSNTIAIGDATDVPSSLSEDTRELLAAAILPGPDRPSYGMIVHAAYQDGEQIRAGNHYLVRIEDKAAVVARWKTALGEAMRKNLVTPNRFGCLVYRLTPRGHKAAVVAPPPVPATPS